MFLFYLLVISIGVATIMCSCSFRRAPGGFPFTIILSLIGTFCTYGTLRALTVSGDVVYFCAALGAAVFIALVWVFAFRRTMA